jgi:hypothetical protein
VSRPDARHYETVASEMLDGWVTPFLGAGVNLAERAPKTPWKMEQEFPSGVELAAYLASRRGVRYPNDQPKDLLRVSQYFDAVLGALRLYDTLHGVFALKHAPTKVHRLLADVAAKLEARGSPRQLLITTNYDDALERAFVDKGVEYDLVWYEAKKGSARGKFYHRPPGGNATLIERPDEFAAVDFEIRPVILKLHGTTTESRRDDSYVITEDHYIDYLTEADIPAVLTERMAETHFLFLGYSLHDWNLRVILNRLWREQQLGLPSWSIQIAIDRVEKRAWEDRGGEVELFAVPLLTYVEKLAKKLDAQSRDGASAAV